MTLPRIGMDMDAHDNHPPPLLTQQHGMVAWLEHMRAEVRCTLFFHLAPPSLLSPSLPPFPFWVHTQHHSSPRPRFFPLVSSPCLVFYQPCCSVCHCMIVILTTHSHNAAFFPSPPLFPPSHSQHASRLHLDARLHPHEKKGCWQHHLKRTFSQKSTPPFLQHLPVPHVFEDTTLQLLCAARRHHHHHHHCKATSALVCWHQGRSQCQPPRRWASQQRILTTLFLLLLSSHQWLCFFHLQGRGV